MSAKGLVILIFDTLRTDFREICAIEGVRNLGAFDRLNSFTVTIPKMRCGSFPTLPMRTDVFTGKLSFLDRRWARPSEGERVFTHVISSAGVRTELVTDNYMMVIPELGGTLNGLFNECFFERGAGADPWQRTDQHVQPSRRPTRSLQFEAQFLANARSWDNAGGPPWERLFNQADARLERLAARERFLLWVDCFSTHEPWLGPNDTPEDCDIISPPYGGISEYTPSELATLRRQYAQRIAAVDKAMDVFTQRLESMVNKNDIALALLSDHGFLFGEFGVVGKPASAPILPPLHDLVARYSKHFTEFLNSDCLWQPHDLPGIFCRVLGMPSLWDLPKPKVNDRPQLIGRNSPDAPTLTVANNNGFALIFRNHLARDPRWYSWASLKPDLPWQSQGDSDIPSDILNSMRSLVRLSGEQSWLEEFHSSHAF